MLNCQGPPDAPAVSLLCSVVSASSYLDVSGLGARPFPGLSAPLCQVAAPSPTLAGHPSSGAEGCHLYILNTPCLLSLCGGQSQGTSVPAPRRAGAPPGMPSWAGGAVWSPSCCFETRAWGSLQPGD